MEESEKCMDKEPVLGGCDPDQRNASGEHDSAQSTAPENEPVKSAESEPTRSRLKLFNKVMEKSFQRLITDASFQRFARSFHPLYKQNKQMTEAIHKQFISDLQKSIQEDISRVIEEGELHIKLDELDKLEELAKNTTQPAWRPSGCPERDLSSSLVPYFQAQEEYLCRELRKLQKENTALAERVQAGRQAIVQTEQRITATVEEWKASVGDMEAFVSSVCPSETFDF
ncbi:polyamine-modulated factor 1 [Chanos chanos]|uniref:Polyamine-modulated factor 1 n=1 Tax=Chanos chanos TaxID=29144 RepID=A0A6J2X0I9_CHACN|nr:polyamine-modulated factor 1-like [Chanos chanos]